MVKTLFFALLLLAAVCMPAAEVPATQDPLKELILLLPPYANASAGVIDLTAFDPESSLLADILSFTELDELLDDFSVTPSAVCAISFGSEIQAGGRGNYYVIRFRKPDAEKYMTHLMKLRGARKEGGRIFFGHGRKYAEMLAPDKVYVVHAPKEMWNLPRSRTLKKNKLVRVLFQERPTLVMHYSWDIKAKNEYAKRESTCNTALFTIDSSGGDSPVYHMQTLYNCIDFQLVSNELQINMRRELIRKDMAGVIRRLEVKVDQQKNKIMFHTQIGTWEPGEFEGLLDALEINGRVWAKRKAGTSTKKK